MPQTVKCPYCSAPVSIPDNFDPATRTHCPACQGEFAVEEVSAGAIAGDAAGGHPDALDFLHTVTGEVPAEEATSTDHLAFLQSQPAAATPPPPAVPAPASPADLPVDSPSHATTYRELFGVDPPADNSPGDRPSAMEAFDFDFLRNSQVLPAPGEIPDEPDTVAAVVIPELAAAPAIEATSETVEPPMAPSQEAAQGLEIIAPSAGGVQLPDFQSVTMLVVEPAPLVDLVEVSSATAEAAVAETTLPAPSAEAAVGGPEPDAAAPPEAITPQRSFFQFAMATVDLAAVSEPIVAAAESPTMVPEVAEVAAEPSLASADFPVAEPEVALSAATALETPASEDNEYAMAAESEVAEPDEAFDVGSEEFAGLSAAEPSGETAPIPLPRERLPRRKQKPSHPIRNIVGLVLGGFCGLFLGYSLLCLIFGAEIDALHVYYKEPAGAVSRRAHPPTANQDDGRPKSPFELLEEQQEAKNAKQHQ